MDAKSSGAVAGAAVGSVAWLLAASVNKAMKDSMSGRVSSFTKCREKLAAGDTCRGREGHAPPWFVMLWSTRTSDELPDRGQRDELERRSRALLHPDCSKIPVESQAHFSRIQSFPQRLTGADRKEKANGRRWRPFASFRTDMPARYRKSTLDSWPARTCTTFSRLTSRPFSCHEARTM